MPRMLIAAMTRMKSLSDPNHTKSLPRLSSDNSPLHPVG
jgi:hypothetical protein